MAVDLDVETWTVADAADLYEVSRWGKGYFSVGSAGNLLVHPGKQADRSIDLKQLVDRLQMRGIDLPILLRFGEILQHRLKEIHDAFVQAMAEGAGIIAATPVTDTIKQVDGRGRITATPDRSGLWAAQTPQGFGVEQLRQAHGRAQREGWSVTDDAALYERLGLPVRVLEAPPSNIKLTTRFDLTVASAVLAARGA